MGTFWHILALIAGRDTRNSSEPEDTDRASGLWVWICLFLTVSGFGFSLLCTIPNLILYLPYAYHLPNCTLLTLFEFSRVYGKFFDRISLIYFWWSTFLFRAPFKNSLFYSFKEFQFQRMVASEPSFHQSGVGQKVT